MQRLTTRRFAPLLFALLFAALPAAPAAAQDAITTRKATPLPVTFRAEKPRGPVVVQGGETADPIENALSEYRRTGSARTIRQSNYVAYPFGHSQPTLTCAPLRACVIELEAGEVLTAAPIAGDTERWIIGQAFTGQSGSTPLVVVKPTDWNLTTNLIIATDRRIYELTLDAPPTRRETNDRNPQALYTRRIRFYYPDDMVRAAQMQQAGAERLAAATVPMNAGFRLENLNFNYEWSREGGFPFDLEQAFDDGAHTYLKVPAQAKNSALPVLFMEEGGERQILNYTVRAAGEGSQYYITDRVLTGGVLVIGVRDKNWLGKSKHDEKTLRIANLDRR